MTQLLHPDLTYIVRGVLFDVYNQLGPLLPERFYQEAIAVGLAAKGVEYRTEKAFEVYYRRQRVGLYYVDIWIEGGKLILELKVAPQILPVHQAQTLSYLKVTDADLAIVANFGAGKLEDKRLPNFLRGKIAHFEWEQRPVGPAVPYPELTNHLLEACHQVHFELGPGFLSQVYRRATMIELQHRGVKYEYIKKIPLTYQGCHLGEQDVRLICVENKVILATVAAKQVNEVMTTQLKSRLRHLGFQFGFITNFYETTLQIVTVYNR